MVKEVKFSYEELSQVLRYDADTGEFTWRVSINSRAKVGERAGVWQRMQNGKDYYSVTYKGRKMSGAQLAWLLHYGEWPDRSVFYIDNDTTNLRISNLKMAEHKAVRVTKEDGTVGYKMSEEQVRHYGLKRYYDMSITEYAQKFAAQNGVCAICEKPETAKIPGRKTDKGEDRIRDLSVDHNHATGAIRDLLCNACNHSLGEMKENKFALLKMVLYLTKHEGKNDEQTENFNAIVRQAITCLPV
jgi:hypothetical protein